MIDVDMIGNKFLMEFDTRLLPFLCARLYCSYPFFILLFSILALSSFLLCACPDENPTTAFFGRSSASTNTISTVSGTSQSAQTNRHSKTTLIVSLYRRTHKKSRLLVASTRLYHAVVYSSLEIIRIFLFCFFCCRVFLRFSSLST